MAWGNQFKCTFQSSFLTLSLQADLPDNIPVQGQNRKHSVLQQRIGGRIPAFGNGHGAGVEYLYAPPVLCGDFLGLQHRPSTVFEVLLFAIARQIIIDHANPLNSLIGVIAIAILFATRKFLFSEFEESEKVIFRATSKVRHVNSIIHVHIPYHDEQTLLDVLKERFAQEKTDVGVGACTYYDNFGLRVAKMHNGEISRVEVIRSIH